MNPTFQPDGCNIEITTACPLRCPQCYCSLEGGKHIPLETATEMLRQAAALGVTHAELSGGETMCYPHLYELVAVARSFGIAPSIATSGWKFDDTALERLIDAGIDTIAISLNGPTEAANALTRDGYALAIQALEVLQRHPFHGALINWVMHRDSVPLLPQMIALAEQYEIDTILIIEPKPTAAGDLETYPTPEQLRQVADMVKNPHGNVELVVQHCFSPLLALSCDNRLWGNRNRGPYKGCTAGTVSYCVDVQGRFSPCRHLEFFETHDSAAEYWQSSPVLASLRQTYAHPQGKCASCRLHPYCRHCVAIPSKLRGTLCFDAEHCKLWEAVSKR